MRLRLLGAAAIACVMGLAAHADTFNFQYTFSNNTVLSGTLTGTLQADHNTFNVTGASNIVYNGAPLTINPTAFQSYSSFYNNGSFGNSTIDASGVVTVNGSYENLIDYSSTSGNGFIFNVGTGTSRFDPDATVVVLGLENDEAFAPSRFAASASVAATPEPSSFALLGTGVLGVCGALRRRFA